MSVSVDRDCCCICLESEGHIRVSVLKQLVKRIGVDVVVYDPILFKHTLVMCQRNCPHNSHTQ